MEVLAKGSAAGSDDEDNAGGDEATTVCDGPTIDEEKNNWLKKGMTHTHNTRL